MRFRKPRLHQSGNPVKGSYILASSREIRFAAGNYDRAKPLVIDPVVQFVTYIGGRGFDTVYGVTVDPSGNILLTGFSSSANLFPPGVNRPQTELSGFVMKLNPTATAVLYVSYLGGGGAFMGSPPWGIASDAQGNAYVAGGTASADFPTTPGAFRTTLAGSGTSDAYLAKINPTGTALVYSTLLGGSQNDYGVGVALDPTGNAYIVGTTLSTDFPTTAGVPRRAPAFPPPTVLSPSSTPPAPPWCIRPTWEATAAPKPSG